MRRYVFTLLVGTVLGFVVGQSGFKRPVSRANKDTSTDGPIYIYREGESHLSQRYDPLTWTTPGWHGPIPESEIKPEDVWVISMDNGHRFVRVVKR